MPEQPEPEVFQSPTEDAADLELIYRVEGQPNELDVFELARVLDSFGNVLKESYRIAHPNEGELRAQHPSPPSVQTVFDVLDIPLRIETGPEFALIAVLVTPRGRIELR